MNPAFPITVYGKPDAMCFGCKKTKEHFNTMGVQYRYVDLTDPANEADLKAIKALGFSSAPYVITPNDEWAGLMPGKFKAAADEYLQAVASS